MLGKRDQLLDVVAERRAGSDLPLVVFLEALHDALRISFLESQDSEGPRCRVEGRAEHLAHRRDAHLGIFVSVGAAVRPDHQRELREARAHALHDLHRGLGIVDGDEQQPGASRAGGFEQVEPRRVAVVRFPAEAAHGVDLAGIVVDDRGADPEGAQHANDHLAEAAEAGDDHGIGLADGVGRALDRPVEAPHEETLVAHDDERRGQHRHGHRRVQDCGHRRRKKGACRPEQHEREFAGLRKRHGEEPGVGALAITECLRNRKEDDCLEQHDAERQAEHQVRRAQKQADVHRHAHGDEKQAEQQPLERLDVELELVPVLAIGEHHAGEERAERHRQPDPCHQRGGAENEQQRKPDEHFAQAGLGHVAQHRAHQEPAGNDEQRDHADRLRRVRPLQHLGLPADQADDEEQRDHGQVLEQQHRERGLAARGRQQVLLGEGGQADGGRGHRESHPGDRADGERQPERDADAGDRRDGRHDLHAAEAEDRAPQRPDALRVELQADEKQQEHDAELGELQHGLRVRDEAQAPGPDRHAGDQVAEHRPQAEPLAQGHGNDACGQVDQGLLKKAVRFHG